LSAFCLKRLLDGCRSPLALDLWPSLMCGDGWAGVSHTSTMVHTMSNQSACSHTGIDRPNTVMTPDLLTLIYKTSDMRIRKVLMGCHGFCYK
uniref:Secreted protein n=1 Tax=Echinostoma caproni TaxID=27848 RepID=A0A183A2Q3_9TREM